jgi:putative hydrolase of the HAD superfamily
MIKAILFDFDGVLTLDATGSETIRNYICKETGLDKELFKKEYKKYNNQLLYGKTTHEEIWGNICSGINKEIDIQVLYDSFINTPINNEMYDLVKEIKNRNYKTAMVTDNKKDRIESAATHFGLDKLFDEIIVSAEIGSGKEAKEIFITTIQRLNVNADECIFIDNSEKNLVAPKVMGMKTIFYNHEERNVVRLTKELRDFGVEI